MLTSVRKATLVLGPTDAHLVYDDPANSLFLSEDCGINGAVADCTVLASVDGSAMTYLATETATGFEIQGNATPAPSATGNGASAASTPTAGGSATDSPGAAPTGSGNNNGAGRMTASAALPVVFAGLVSAFFL